LHRTDASTPRFHITPDRPLRCATLTTQPCGFPEKNSRPRHSGKLGDVPVFSAAVTDISETPTHGNHGQLCGCPSVLLTGRRVLSGPTMQLGRKAINRAVTTSGQNRHFAHSAPERYGPDTKRSRPHPLDRSASGSAGGITASDGLAPRVMVRHYAAACTPPPHVEGLDRRKDIRANFGPRPSFTQSRSILGFGAFNRVASASAVCLRWHHDSDSSLCSGRSDTGTKPAKRLLDFDWLVGRTPPGVGLGSPLQPRPFRQAADVFVLLTQPAFAWRGSGDGLVEMVELLSPISQSFLFSQTWVSRAG